MSSLKRNLPAGSLESRDPTAATKPLCIGGVAVVEAARFLGGRAHVAKPPSHARIEHPKPSCVTISLPKNAGSDDLASVLLEIGRIFHERIMDLLCDVSVLCRISLRCMEVLSSTGFSLCGVLRPGKSKPHRLKPVLLDRTRPVAACGEIRGKSPRSSCEKCARGKP